MKKTQIKDLHRTIRRQWVSFVSIIVITVLGVIAYLGVDYTAFSLRKNGSALYDRMNFRDIEIISTLLFTDDDLTAIRDLEGVSDAEAVRLMSGNVSHGEKSENVSIISVTERINMATVLQGRMPESATECAVEEPVAESMGLKVGDTLVLSSRAGNENYLIGSSFSVVGIVNHPDHINNNAKELLYVMTAYDAFDAAALNNCFMKVVLTVKKAANVNRLSEQYDTSVAKVLSKVDDLSLSRTEKRDNELINGAASQIEDAKQQLENGFAQLESAKASVRSALRQVMEIIFKEDGENMVFKWADERTPDVNDPSETAMYLYITENIRMDLKYSAIDTFRAVVYSESIPESALTAVYKQLFKEDLPRSDGGTGYDIEAVRAKIMTTASEYAESLDELAKECAAWDEGHARYTAGLETYREKISAFQPCRWLSFDARGNASFVQMQISSENLANLKLTFSLIFVCVGVLVVLATVGKMVDEQRELVGTAKSLGLFYREIFAKYLLFGLLATACGTFLGILTARFIVSPFLLANFARYYRHDVTGISLDAAPTLIACAAGALLTTAAVWFACRKLLSEPAVRLLQPKAPGVKKSSRRKGRHVLTLYSRLILMNIRTDIKRVIVTIVSVAGCCSLMVIGITLRSSVSGSLVKQYGEVVMYDEYVTYNPDVSVNGGREFREILQSAGVEYTDVYAVNATYHSTNLHIAELFCGNLKEIHDFYRLCDWKTGEPLTGAVNGVLIPRRTAEVYGLDVGSELEIAIGGTDVASVRIAGVFENYVGSTIVMSGSYYEKVYGRTLQPNAFMVKLNGNDAEKLNESLQVIDGYEALTRSDVSRSIVENASSALKASIWLCVGIAAAMAGVVQLNLTNMYVLQKKRELTIMRINGFTTGEVIGYMVRETVFTTIIGILTGTGVGAALAYKILRTLEQPILQFKRDVDVIALIVAAVLTIVFTVVVNAIALRKVKGLKLTDID